VSDSDKPDVIFDSSNDGKYRITLILQNISLFTSNTAYFSTHSETSKYMAVYRGMNLYDHFILDSGPSSYIISRKDIFMSGTYRAIDCPTSKGISDSSLKAISIGTLRLKCNNGRWIQLRNVQYSPQVGVNLLLLNKLWP
jgi:hypothetical protein